MSGTIKSKIRLSRSKDKRYNLYPEIFWEVTGEDGTTTQLSPSYDDLVRALIDFRRHELKVDKTRQRKRYTSTLIKTFENAIKYLKQMTLDEINYDDIEDIYFKPIKLCPICDCYTMFLNRFFLTYYCQNENCKHSEKLKKGGGHH